MVLENSIKKDNKITLTTLKFSNWEYEKIKNKNRLSETTIDLLHLTKEYGKKTWSKRWNYCSFSWQSIRNDRKRYVWNVSDLLLCKFV